MKKTALITGASRGLGLAIATLFKANGIQVLMPTREELDLSSGKSIERYLSKLNVVIDILVNNAGVNLLGETVDLSDADIDETFNVNLFAPIRLIRQTAQVMLKQKYGRILNVSSIWSVVAKPGRGIYAASKAGLDAITRSVAVELAKYNILVNSIAPGYVDTDLTRKNLSEKELGLIKQHIPVGRLAQTKEIAELAWFLCSEKNTYITGQTILIDGGYTCH